jgi:hypothetical protein
VRHNGSGPQLVVLAHHSIMDGDSVVLFLKELVTHVNALRRRFPDSPTALEALLAMGPGPLPFLPAQDELYAQLLKGEEGAGWWSRLRFALKRLHWSVVHHSKARHCTAQHSKARGYHLILSVSHSAHQT